MSQVSHEELGPLIGHQAACATWSSAVISGRLHHAWLLSGPRGIGKAHAALQFAVHLLSGAPKDFAFGETEQGPVGRLLVAGSHPDIRIIRRPVDDKGKMKSEIPVDGVRELESFFSLRPAFGGWRIAIIDAVDELNRNSANALLKTLEEPPKQSVLMLVSHGERALLPTIRSRCRLLRFGPLSATESDLVLANAGADHPSVLRALAPGRPGAAITLGAPEARQARELVERVFPDLGRLDANAFQALINAASRSDAAFASTMEALRRKVEDRARSAPNAERAGAWAAAALELVRLGSEAGALNMDKAQTIAEALKRIEAHLSAHATAGAA